MYVIQPSGSPRIPYAGPHARRSSPSSSSRVAGANINMHLGHNSTLPPEQQHAIDMTFQRQMERERGYGGNGSKHIVGGAAPGDAFGGMRPDSPSYHAHGQFGVQGHPQPVGGRHPHHHHHRQIGGMQQQPGQNPAYPLGSSGPLTAQQQHIHHMQQERERFEYEMERERGRRRERDGVVRAHNGGGKKRGGRMRSYSAGSSSSSLSIDEMLLAASTDKREREGSAHSHHRHREHGHHHHSYESSVVGGRSASGRRSRSGTMPGPGGSEGGISSLFSFPP